VYAILTTLVENSIEAAEGRLAACLGHHCPSRDACAVALEIEGHGVSAEPPLCPITVEHLAMLWGLLTKGDL